MSGRPVLKTPRRDPVDAKNETEDNDRIRGAHDKIEGLESEQREEGTSSHWSLEVSQVAHAG